jgi:calcineurin-like phosphoesterase family protein
MSKERAKRIYVTSDWHLGHHNVLKFCPYTRPFESIDEMTAKLRHNYIKTIKPGDTVYFLGDISFKGYEYTRPIIAGLPGTKIAVRGNHDKGHIALLQSGFDAVVDYVEVMVLGKHVTMSHFPLRGIIRESGMESSLEGWHGESKYSQSHPLPRDVGQDLHLHGHIHSPNKGRSRRICGKQFDVGVDANNLTPISLKTIISIMKRGGV